MTATTHNEGLRLSKIAKNNGITKMVGGYHPTSIPELLLSHPQWDMVVRGEGELTVREIVEKGCPENVLGISYKKDERIIHNKDRPLLNDLDRLPFPARHLRKYTYKANDRKTDFDVLVTSRGCYGQCKFCCEPIMNHSYLRCRSPENVVKEVLEIARYHEMRPVNVFTADPMFIGNPERVGLLCDLLQEHDLDMKFNALVRADNMARNPEIVKKMCKAGIDHFEMGIESPNPIELESTKKGITNRIQKRGWVRWRNLYNRSSGPHRRRIRKFPVYAKEIGLTSAAFGIATPRAHTSRFFYSISTLYMR
jgi:magnesium-protoporphyrin IX monomethyl ester (oxidative) cyclase